MAVVAGKIERIELPNVLYLSQRSGQEIPVQFTATANFWHRTKTANLSTFVPGDEVTAEGDWNGESFQSSYLTTLYRPVTGTIIRRTGDSLETTGGSIHLAPDTVPWERKHLSVKSLAGLAPNDEIFALAWQHPDSHQLIAAQVGIVEAL
jgi:hypothetical protein